MMLKIVVLGSLYLKGHVDFQKEIIHFLDKTCEPTLQPRFTKILL